MLLMGCTTSQPISQSEEIEYLRRDITTLQSRNKDLTFQIETDKCFILYNKCRLDKRLAENVCWQYHAACVIDAHKRYKEK